LPLAVVGAGAFPIFVVIAETHGLELLEALLGLRADWPVRIEVDRLLIRFQRTGLHYGRDLIALRS